jgi:hypothetical protein
MTRFVTVEEFARREPALGGKHALYAHIREKHFEDFIWRVGRRVFIDVVKFEALHNGGGPALPAKSENSARRAG